MLPDTDATMPSTLSMCSRGAGGACVGRRLGVPMRLAVWCSRRVKSLNYRTQLSITQALP
ncbi:hypothetical protein I552_5758 [Mycobacterium xenopi 3993]|nr:hypothetical protein I552_5758 [Mycobacterium xenopi 3993]